MENAFQIIDIMEDHINGFHECLDSVAREGKYLAFSEAPPLESTKEFVQENIGNGEIQLVALDQSDVVGWIDILRGTRKTNHHCGRLGMGILPDWRGNGLGRRLMEAALEKVRRTDLRLIQLDVFETNHRAIALYESYGFKREGLRIGASFVDGEYINDIPMAKQLI